MQKQSCQFGIALLDKDNEGKWYQIFLFPWLSLPYWNEIASVFGKSKISLPQKFPKKVPCAGGTDAWLSFCIVHIDACIFLASAVASLMLSRSMKAWASSMCCSVTTAQERQPEHILIPPALILGQEGKGKAHGASVLAGTRFWRSEVAEILVLLLPWTALPLVHPQHRHTKPFAGFHQQKWCTTSSPSRHLGPRLPYISPGLMPLTLRRCAQD